MNYSANPFNPVMPYNRDRADSAGFEQATRNSISEQKKYPSINPGSSDFLQTYNSNSNYISYEQPNPKPYSNFNGEICLTQEAFAKEEAQKQPT